MSSSPSSPGSDSGPGVLDAEGVGGPLVCGVSLPVDAVGVDLQQDGDAVRGALANGISDLHRRWVTRLRPGPGYRL